MMVFKNEPGLAGRGKSKVPKKKTTYTSVRTMHGHCPMWISNLQPTVVRFQRIYYTDT